MNIFIPNVKWNVVKLASYLYILNPIKSYDKSPTQKTGSTEEITVENNFRWPKSEYVKWNVVKLASYLYILNPIKSYDKSPTQKTGSTEEITVENNFRWPKSESDLFKIITVNWN